MRVGPGQAEGVHPDDPRYGAAQRGWRGRYPYAGVFPVNRGGRLVQVDLRGYDAVARDENALEQAEYPGRRVKVAEVGLVRAHK